MNIEKKTIITAANELDTDPFDPSSLRLNQNFSENLGARKVIVVIPVRKPKSQEFIRVLADESKTIVAAILDCQADKELYLVAPAMAELIGKEAKPCRLTLATTATGDFFLWPMKITPEGARENTWNMSAEAAYERAIKNWVNISSNLSAQAYDVRIAEGSIPDPDWPDLPLKEILRLSFKDRFIQSMDHPIVKKLKGVL